MNMNHKSKILQKNKITTKSKKYNKEKLNKEILNKNHQGQHKISFPIVGIGASAGGLEAFIQILKKLPNDIGLAIIFVQHLDPTHQSLAPEILSRSTDMPIHEVIDGQCPLPNNIYLIPPNFNMEIFHGTLNLLPRTEIRGQHLSIDSFFKSLAIDQKSHAIGIILSGTASDGTQGLNDIKTEGGYTIAQDPKTAKFDGMPKSAIESGVVDMVLTPENIAKELVRIGKHSFLINNPKKIYKNQVSKDVQDLQELKIRNTVEVSLRKIFSLLRTHTQVDFSEYKLPTIKRRIKRRMIVRKSKNLEEYVKFLLDNPSEINELYSDILINVTSFFRDPEAFSVIRNQILPVLIKKKSGNSTIRIWVAGCSSGEEAYSLAIILIEYLNEIGVHFPIQIFATDISEISLKKARVGFYSEEILSQLSKERVRNFFEKIDGGYKIIKTIRDLCLFTRHDIANDPPFSKMDLISCRNVMIYFGSYLQKRIFPILHYALNSKGFLWMGNSESCGEGSKLFVPIDKIHKIYSKINIQSPMSIRPFVNNSTTYINSESIRQTELLSPITNIFKDADRIALLKYVPPFVIINSSLDIIQYRGRTAPYLEPAPGSPSNNILKMVRTELLTDLNRMIQKAKKQNTKDRIENLSFEVNGNN